jgi:hypothetical protein
MPGKHVHFASKIEVFPLPSSPAPSTPLSSYSLPTATDSDGYPTDDPGTDREECSGRTSDVKPNRTPRGTGGVCRVLSCRKNTTGLFQQPPPPVSVTTASVIPDDSSLSTLPRGQVDYLSHDWQEEDMWRSWQKMTRQKNEITNGQRLENASWRTWWKQMNKLQMVTPETLNW